ncbi:undecaprenyl-diphosphate phosphatase [Candidatus Xianfuyuplasma coldseepsis]|uniref:Undecaprenyl-diphosphatase n=1 Tax=Candidatus Xianfuyuplasma coldseepsis TaxID=2782163 RepID=A0A7L7KPP2_9MOLU|nr:undecaprenyl-diphosphate phosphatase [Xianfuyuplasma coldseepsis]QMS84647.1 undecaprenyl-diphosphate phosphatase [Xianfuyuplasma coldseepsis]
MEFIELLKTILLGIVEGITEWLPISSTGHMILLDEWIQLQASDAFKEMFLVVIQLGAILAVVVLYFERLNPFSAKKSTSEKKQTFDTWFKVIVGVIPAAVLGLLFDDWLNDHLYNYITVAITLILYGALFIVIETTHQTKEQTITSMKDLSYKTAFLIGLFQVLSLIPGTSRSGATILGGIILGGSRVVAAEFSFFLSIPVMFGASFLKLYKFGFNFTGVEIVTLAIGMVTAFIVSIIAIKFLLGYIKNHDFKVFGYYRIVLGVLVVIYFLFQ